MAKNPCAFVSKEEQAESVVHFVQTVELVQIVTTVSIFVVVKGPAELLI